MGNEIFTVHQEYRPSLFASMKARKLILLLLLNGIDKRAEEMYESLVSRMSECEGLTEMLKREDPMAWVSLANSIRHFAEEIVKAEVVYSRTISIQIARSLLESIAFVNT